MVRVPDDLYVGDARCDVRVDLHKPAGWHDAACALRGCVAADCYASFCALHAGDAPAGPLFICPMCASGAAPVPSSYSSSKGERAAHEAEANRRFWSAAEGVMRGAPRGAAHVLLLDHDGGSVRRSRRSSCRTRTRGAAWR